MQLLPPSWPTGYSLVLALGLAMLLLAGCATQTAPSPDPSTQHSTAETASQDTGDDCVRGKPSALLAEGAAFQATSAREALETVHGDAVPALQIRHYGCAHYALDFTFTWPPSAAPSRAAALQAASRRLASLRGVESTAPILKQLDEALRAFANQPLQDHLGLDEMTTVTLASPSANVLVITYDVAL